MPTLPIIIITLFADLLIFLFVGYYFFKFRGKEKALEKREGKVDSDYHQIVDNALTKERRILEDATSEASHILKEASSEADHIIRDAHHTTTDSQKEVDEALKQLVTEIRSVSKDSKETVTSALKQLITEIEKETLTTSQSFMKSYQESLKQLMVQSLTDMQSVTKELETDLHKQIKDFHDTLLPGLEKELEAYKQARMEQTEQTITKIVQKVSQETLNKTLTADDHQKLVIEALEKAKKEGVFN